MTQLELCNVALAHLGEARIGAVGEGTAAARACALHYAPVRDEVLRSHRWNFALRRHRARTAWVTLTGGAVAGVPGGVMSVTSVGHGLVTGDRVHLREVAGVNANGAWEVTRVSGDVFSLDGSVFSGTYVVNTGEWTRVPAFGWAWSFALPVDCLRCLEVNGSEAGDWSGEEWLVEGRQVLTNAEAVDLVYVRSVGDEALTDPLFAQAFGLKLAVALAETIRGGTGRTGELLQVYQNVTAPLARRVDANEGRRRKGMLPMNSAFVRARAAGV